MSPLAELLIQAKASALHHNVPAYRDAAAREARLFLERFFMFAWPEPHSHLIGALLAMMQALPLPASGEARAKLAQAIAAIADAIRAEPLPRPACGPRLYWMEGSQA